MCSVDPAACSALEIYHSVSIRDNLQPSASVLWPIMSGPRKPSYLLPCILQTKGSHCGNSTQLSGAVRLLVPETEPVQCRMGRGRAPGACWLAKSLTEGLNLTCQVLPPRQHDSCFLLKRKGQILASSVVMHFSGAMNSRLSGVFIKSETQ